MKQPKISIIIPVYNGEKYLKRCLDSVLNQTMSEIEIIVVNDGSSDYTSHILEDYEVKDNRITIINQKNQGLSEARNTGVLHVNTEYLMFLDADDWISKENCEKAYEAIEKEKADIVFWAYQREYKTRTLAKSLFSCDQLFDDKQCRFLHRRFVGLLNEELMNPEQSDAIATAWGKLYKTSVILEKNIIFVDLKKIGTYEDGLFNLNYFAYVKKAVYLNYPFYHYYKVNDSSLTKTYKKGLFEGYQNLFVIMKQYIEENDLDLNYKEALENRRCMSLIGIGLTECIQSNPKSHLEKIKFIKGIINNPSYKNAYKQLKLNYFPLKWRIFFGSAKYNFATGVYILLLIINKIIAR